MRRLLFALGIALLALEMAEAQTVPNSPKDINDALLAIKSNDPVMRAAGLSFVALLGQDARAATRDVVNLLFDSNKDVRYWAFQALPNVAPTLAEPVIALVNSNDEEQRLQALQKLAALGAGGAAATPALLRLYQQAQSQERPLFVHVLAAVGVNDPTTAKTLAEIALQDSDAVVRRAALQDISRLRNLQGAVRVFTALLQDTDPAARAQAVVGLTALAPINADAMKWIKAALNDPSPTVRAAAKQALEKLAAGNGR
jgi:HEAT repeat protein